MDNEKINSELEDIQEDITSEDTKETEGSEQVIDEPQDMTEDITGETELEASEAYETEETDEESSEKKTKSSLRTMLEYVELFAVAMFVVLFLFSFVFKICVVDGNSMLNTLHNGEKLITTNLFYTPKTEDIIVFYEDNGVLRQPLVKRVIATEGQELEINYYEGTVKVDGQLLCEDYAYLSNGVYITNSRFDYDHATGIMKMTIPEDKLFVMGDNRNDSWDSRSRDIGCISESQIMGKVVFRISPFTTFN